MKEGRFEDYLDICLNRLDRGENLPDVLKSYPTLERRLKPLLLVAMLSRALPQPAPRHTSIRTGMNHLLVEMDVVQAAGGFRKAKPQPTQDRVLDRWLESIPNPFSSDRVAGLKLSYRIAIITLALIIGGSFITLSASASGLSGTVFNNLKRGLERVRSVFIFNQPDVGIQVEDDEFPKGDNRNQSGSTEPDQEEGILPVIKSNSESGDLDSEPDYFLDFYDESLIDDLKEADKLDKEEEKEADKLDKEEEKDIDKLDKEADKEEKEDDKDKDKEDKDKDKEDKDKDK